MEQPVLQHNSQEELLTQYESVLGQYIMTKLILVLHNKIIEFGWSFYFSPNPSNLRL